MIQILFYILMGAAAVYIVETKIRNKPLTWEWRILLSLTGPAGFFTTLIIYGIKRLF